MFKFLAHKTAETAVRCRGSDPISITVTSVPDPYLFPGSVSKVGLDPYSHQLIQIQQQNIEKINKTQLRTKILLDIDLNLHDYLLKSDVLILIVILFLAQGMPLEVSLSFLQRLLSMADVLGPPNNI